MAKETLVYPDGRGGVPSVEGLTDMRKAAKLRAKQTAAVIRANAKATGMEPKSALLRYGSITVYQATQLP